MSEDEAEDLRRRIIDLEARYSRQKEDLHRAQEQVHEYFGAGTALRARLRVATDLLVDGEWTGRKDEIVCDWCAASFPRHATLVHSPGCVIGAFMDGLDAWE